MSHAPRLESRQNPRIKQIVGLKERRERKKSGLTRIDGGRELLRALEAGVRPERVYLCPERVAGPDTRAALARARAEDVPLQEISSEIADHIRYGERDEGVCALVTWRPRELSRLEARSDLSFLLVVEGVEKPGNLGALLRSADGAGVDAVLFVDPACELANPNVIRASMGTLFTQEVHEATGERAREWLRRSPLQVVITRPGAPHPYTDLDLRAPTALVLGSEDRGLDPAWDAVDATAVHLPMRGRADSLNLSASAAILLYEVLRQRGG